MRAVLLCCLFFPWWVLAGFGFNQTRAIFHEGDKSVAVKMRNTNKAAPYLVKSWVEDRQGEQGVFMVVPPITRIEANSVSVVKVLPLAKVLTLPRDRESLFSFESRALQSSNPLSPASDEGTGAKVNALIGMNIRLFYRPRGLLMSQQSAFSGLAFRRVPGAVVAKNSSPYYLIMNSLQFGDQSVPLVTDSNTVIAPFGEQNYKAAGKGNQVSWTLLDDEGIPRAFSGVLH